ncbi:hypothetical protein EKTHUN627_26100 [Enterobacter kobei]|nr:hypothetical protein EKTHUN627_26100 [Enterobacter kobei]
MPKKVEFLRAVIVTSKDGEFHIRPLLGITKVNCIHIDEIGECIIKGGDNGVVIHVIPLINSFTLPLILSIFLAIFYVW